MRCNYTSHHTREVAVQLWVKTRYTFMTRGNAQQFTRNSRSGFVRWYYTRETVVVPWQAQKVNGDYISSQWKRWWNNNNNNNNDNKRRHHRQSKQRRDYRGKGRHISRVFLFTRQRRRTARQKPTLVSTVLSSLSIPFSFDQSPYSSSSSTNQPTNQPINQ